MRTILVVRQVARVVDRLMRSVSSVVGLSDEDVMLIAWLSEQFELPASMLAERVGRKPQSVHRSLERLEARGLVCRHVPPIRTRSFGWALTESGQRAWLKVAEEFSSLNQRIARTGRVDTRHLANELEQLLFALSLTPPDTWGNGLIAPPSPPPQHWDL